MDPLKHLIPLLFCWCRPPRLSLNLENENEKKLWMIDMLFLLFIWMQQTSSKRNSNVSIFILCTHSALCNVSGVCMMLSLSIRFAWCQSPSYSLFTNLSNYWSLPAIAALHFDGLAFMRSLFKQQNMHLIDWISTSTANIKDGPDPRK